MMYSRWFIVSLSCFTSMVFALTPEAYLARFQAFQAYHVQLPKEPDSIFIQFISQNKPLSNKLREQWLYQLAREKKWATFSQFYQPTIDINLTCYAQIAHMREGQNKLAIPMAKTLWLSPNSLPPSCDAMMNVLKEKNLMTPTLIQDRLKLALNAKNTGLAIFLLRQLPGSHTDNIQRLSKIQSNPSSIVNLPKNDVYQDFYLYGLKRLVSLNMKKAIELFQSHQSQFSLDDSHKQSFISQVALYKAMRGNDDALIWFKKIKPSFYTDILLDWEIRYALKKQLWSQVEQLTRLPKFQKEPAWQYWQARALEHRGDKVSAKKIYQKLSSKRHYYGFLASYRLNLRPQFEYESLPVSAQRLKIYHPITESIRQLYLAKRDGEASRLLNDFMSELPKLDQIALLQWINQELGWYGKAVNLSSSKMLVNQIHLRFPLAYQSTIHNLAARYHIPAAYIFAVIRQESAFRHEVVSGAGAYGLMQIMPKTANLIARKMKIPFRDKKELFNIEKNMTIGVAYLNDLAAHFHRNPMLIAAAYNAGPRQVQSWMKQQSTDDWDIWIDTIPWQETRNYLKNVMAFYVVYQYRLKPTGKLEYMNL